MNQNLHDHVRKTAFFMALSQGQIRLLLSYKYVTSDYERVHYWRSISTIRSLEKSGLLEHDGNSWKTSRAGELMIEFLEEAGFKHEAIGAANQSVVGA